MKFEEVEISGRFLLASALGVLHLRPSTTLGIVGLAHLDASISSTIWALEAAMTMVLVSTGFSMHPSIAMRTTLHPVGGNGGGGLSLPKFIALYQYLMVFILTKF